ncbi:MAG: glycosyltransferase [Hyphomicrobiales bacterium]
MKVAFLGAFDPAYPRTRVLEEGLRARGVEVTLLAQPPRARPVVREARLLGAWIARSAGADAFLVPSFGHRDVPFAALLARVSGVPLLFDPLVSRWDTQVRDLGRVRERSLAARRLRASDRMALRAADLVLCDTWEHGDFFGGSFGVPRSRIARIPVGADHEAFARGASRAASRAPRAAGAPLEVVYVGGFLPLHGMPAIVEAAAILEARHGAGFARFTLIGGGMMEHRVDRDVAARGLRSVRRVARVPYGEALGRLVAADVALGIFGATEKAARVVPHKVYQALALGVPVVTRRSRAIAEFFRDGEHLVAIPPGDGPALARALETLAADPTRAAAIGAAGRAAALAVGTPERIGDALVEAIGRARALTAPRIRR